MSKITLGYFPGCSGLGTSAEYEKSTRAVCRELGIDLREIPDWNCCGSTPAHTVDPVLSSAFSARVFAQGEQVGITDVITPCPSCLSNLRNALRHMDDELFAARVDALTERPLKQEHSIKSVLQVIVEDIGLDSVKARVRKPLTGLKAVAYYGCLMNRPEKVMRFDDPENPVAMDQVLEVLGAEVLPFPLKVDCCGGSMSIPARRSTPHLAGKILDLAGEMGADVVVVACPLCQMNLDLRQGQSRAAGLKYTLPVPYFTQLMAYAFGLSDADTAFKLLAEDIAPAFTCMSRRSDEIKAEEARKAVLAEEKARAAAEKAAKTQAGTETAAEKQPGGKSRANSASAAGGAA
ncbi:MAG: CoB--CoM heterodisulfide reductase iron-sulfur subunit B family protein [Desulfovibrio sp.]|jgi:heterodisulfide reductase subunit B|nr:CoB--CoM heterodisulfide reductase iron-sulfur subunit B family protein [Desulfovibrio sp.]